MDPLRTTDEVAERLQVSSEHVRRLARIGEIESVRLGHRSIRFEDAAVEAYLQRHRRAAILEEIRATPDGHELTDAALDRAARVVGKSAT